MLPNHSCGRSRRTLTVVAQIGGEPPRSASRAVLIYNVYRLALLAVCLGIGWLATLRGVVLIVAALAVSGVLSWFLLRRQRMAMGMAVERTVERSRVRARIAQRTADEDAYVDTVIAAAPAPGDQPPS
jgi:Protein of unknown function (DUF4229)